MKVADDPRLLRVQGEAESALGELQKMRQEQGKARAEASAAMQDAREALARERDIQDQLQKADQVRGAVAPHGCCPRGSLRARTHAVLATGPALGAGCISSRSHLVTCLAHARVV